MTQCRSRVDSAAFGDALHLHPTVQAVAEYNVAKLRSAGEPTATIKAVHTGPNASKASSEDASGLELFSVLSICCKTSVNTTALVCSTPKVSNGWPGYSRVEKDVHNWRELTKVTHKQTGAPSQSLTSTVWESLTKPLVNLSKELNITILY